MQRIYQFEDAKAYFAKHIDAYRRGGITWQRGQAPNGRMFAAWKWAFGDGQRWKVYFNVETSHQWWRFEVVDVGEREHASPGGPTWCNKAAGIFTWHCLGFDIAYWNRAELDANAIHERLAKGTYGLVDVQPNHAGLVVASAPSLGPGAIGHQAIVDHDNPRLVIQAGAETGFGIPIERAFGAANMGKVKYYGKV
jgi:hypothetical protein